MKPVTFQTSATSLRKSASHVNYKHKFGIQCQYSKHVCPVDISVRKRKLLPAIGVHMQTDFYKAVGLKIRNARMRKEITQEVLAKGVGLTRTSLTNIEKGRQKVLVHTLTLLSEKLEVPIEQLLPQPLKTAPPDKLKFAAKTPKNIRSWVEETITGTP